jgi:hypothetical protein
MELLKKCWNQRLSTDYFFTEFNAIYSGEEKIEIVCKLIKLACSNPKILKY